MLASTRRDRDILPPFFYRSLSTVRTTVSKMIAPQTAASKLGTLKLMPCSVKFKNACARAPPAMAPSTAMPILILIRWGPCSVVRVATHPVSTPNKIQNIMSAISTYKPKTDSALSTSPVWFPVQRGFWLWEVLKRFWLGASDFCEFSV